MNKPIKAVMGILLNLLIAGFFGIIWSVLNMTWLEWAVAKFPKVEYTTDYEFRFSLICGAVLLVLGLLRMIQSQLTHILPKITDMLIISIIAGVCMIALTPVPNSNFGKLIIDRNYVTMQPDTITTDLDTTNTTKTTTGMTLSDTPK
jgi:hypothetical protein